MRSSITSIVLAWLLSSVVDVFAQKGEVPALFQAREPLAIELSLSVREVKKSLADSVYFPSMMKYKNANGVWDSIPVGVRARGKYRRENCFFPPLRVKIKKNDAANTVFQGNKNLKLVLPCQLAKEANHLVMKEYVSYQLYEPITSYFFHTRLVNVTLRDHSGKLAKTYEVLGFLIEDDDLVADRFNGQINETSLHPLQLQDSTALKHDLFQYMISNTDWSSVTSHNIKVLQLKSGQYVPLAYDFDMSGLVNAPYAKPSPLTGQQTVRDRAYRGFCRKPELVQEARQHYLKKQAELMAVIDRHAASFTEKQLADIRGYIDDFYNILKSDRLFKSSILDACRKN